jgi:hypothetical protein
LSYCLNIREYFSVLKQSVFMEYCFWIFISAASNGELHSQWLKDFFHPQIRNLERTNYCIGSAAQPCQGKHFCNSVGLSLMVPRWLQMPKQIWVQSRNWSKETYQVCPSHLSEKKPFNFLIQYLLKSPWPELLSPLNTRKARK